jgi:DegV family protein with EDD domain
MVHISIDSCADLSQDLLERHQLRMIPLHVLVNGVDHYDNDLTLAQLFASVDQTNTLPKTAAPSVFEFVQFFDVEGENIYFGLSSQLSATMQNAQLSKDQLQNPELYLVDSLNLSTGIGLLALKAADLRDEGWSAQEIVDHVTNLRSKVRTSFVIDTMEYLHKGGRCTGVQAFVGSMLKIRPIIHVQEDGALGVLDKVRGSRRKALSTLLAGFAANLPHVDLTRVFVTHSGCESDAEYLAEELNNLAPIQNVLITEAGATIGSHCGPNTIGILYITD